MNLTPEQKAIGKENFYTVVGSTRRDFLKGGVAAAAIAGGGLGSFYFGYEASVANPVRVAVLGTGDEGSVLIGAINPKFIEVKAIADIRPYSQYRAFHGDCYSDAALKVRPGLIAKYGWANETEARKHVKVYNDFRELLEKEKDIEAVIIALPLHLHAPAAIQAMRHGLHVLTEKLMGHTVYDCKAMGRVSEETKKLLATGHQRHYNVLYENAKDTINRGLLGELHYIRAQWHRGNLPGHDSWQMPLPPGVKAGDKSGERLVKELASWEAAMKASKDPKEIAMLDRRIAQKKAQISDEVLKDTAEKYGYENYEIKDGSGKIVYKCPPAEQLIRWRLWDRTGAGLMAELGSHQLDAASIFIAAQHEGKKQIPLTVVAAGNRPLFPADRDVEDHVVCVIEFPAPGYDAKCPIASQKRISVQYSSINGNGFGGYGEVVFGTKGTLILEREQEAMIFKDSDTDSKVGVTASKNGPTMDTQASGGGAQKAAAVGAATMQDVSRGYTEEIEHWAWCIRNPDPKNLPRCHPKVAMGDAIIALVANKAAREGKRIEFDPDWFDIKSDKTPEGVKPDPNDKTRYA